MKAIQILFLCLSAMPAFSQNYHPFIQHGTYRDEFWAPELQICYFSYGARYWFRGDTVLDGQIYQILRSASIVGASDQAPFCPPYLVDTSDYSHVAFFVREDLNEKKVFRLDVGSDVEILLYDFSLNIGDSVTVGDPPQMVYVQDTALETLTDGSSRRVLIMGSGGSELTRWVEGIGSIHSSGTLERGHVFARTAFATRKQTRRCTALCVPRRSGSKSLSYDVSGLSVAPNPAGAAITVALQTRGQAFDRVAVFDMMGQLVVDQICPAATFSVEIPVAALPVGSYLMLVGQNGKWLARQIFQKI